MFGLRATVDADACSVGDRRWAIGRFAKSTPTINRLFGDPAIGDGYAWDVLHDRQQPLEPRRLGDGYMVAEGEDLVSFALEGVTEPTTIYDQSPRNRIALRLVAIKFDEHIIFCYFVTLLPTKGTLILVIVHIGGDSACMPRVQQLRGYSLYRYL